MAEGEPHLLSAARERTLVLGAALVTIVVDSLFLAGVGAMNWGVSNLVFARMTTEGTTELSLQVLEWAFTVSTLATVVSYIVRDLVVGMVKPWRDDVPATAAPANSPADPASAADAGPA